MKKKMNKLSLIRLSNFKIRLLPLLQKTEQDLFVSRRQIYILMHSFLSISTTASNRFLPHRSSRYIPLNLMRQRLEPRIAASEQSVYSSS